MKVLLVRPKPHKETIGLQHVMICEPLELEYLVSNVPPELVGRLQVKIIDLIVEKRSYEKILRSEKPDFIVYTGYITHVGVIKELAEKAKKWFPHVKTGVGGVHAEVVREDFKSKFIDFIYSSNGIDGFNTTLEGLFDNKSPEKIKEELEIITVKKDSFNYAHPQREAVAAYRRHYYYMFHSPCALIKTSFGCPFNCSFCFCKEITAGKYFTRDMEDVIAELKNIEEQEIYIVDDDFLYDRGRLRQFMCRLEEHNIKKKFLVYGRADFITKNKDILRELKQHGLNAVIVGIESVRAEDLKIYNKGTTREINEECIRILQEMDIELYATLIIPLDFSLRDFKELTGWLRGLNVRFVNLQPLTPLPGTGIFKNYCSELLVKREDYHVWDMAHVVLRPEHMSIRRFYAELLKAYYLVVMRPKHIVKLIKKYGLAANLKMLVGSSLVSMQYMGKIVRGR